MKATKKMIKLISDYLEYKAYGGKNDFMSYSQYDIWSKVDENAVANVALDVDHIAKKLCEGVIIIDHKSNRQNGKMGSY